VTISWREVLRLALLVLLPVALLATGLVFLKAILLPFLVGLAAAYMLDPAADRLERMRFTRTTATAVITGTFFIFLTIIVFLLLPPLASQAAELARDLPDFVEKLRSRLMPLLTSLIERFPFGSDFSPESVIRGQAGQAISVAIRSVAGLLQSGVAFLNLVALIFVTPIVTFYLLRDWDHMVAQLRGLVPPDNRAAADRLGREINDVLAGFLRGQGLVCTFLAIFYAIGLWAVDLNYGLIIGLLTGLFSFIPFIGMAIGMAVGVAVAAFQVQQECGIGSEVVGQASVVGSAVVQQAGEIGNVARDQAATACGFVGQWKIPIVIGIFGLGQFIEGNLISPRLVGSRIHLHPVWMIFAVLAGTTLFGLLGTLLAVPFAAVLGVLIRFGLERYQQSELFHHDDDGIAQADLQQNEDMTETVDEDEANSENQLATANDQGKTGTLG